MILFMIFPFSFLGLGGLFNVFYISGRSKSIVQFGANVRASRTYWNQRY